MRRLRLLLAAGALLALAAGSARAGARPEVVADLGFTTGIDGTPSGGGPSLAVAFLWPLEERFRVGVAGVADDLGGEPGRLVGPAGEDLGPLEERHRDVMGVAWRVEAHAPTRAGFDPFLMASWGVFRVADDRRGADLGAVAAAGFAAGAGVLRRMTTRHDAGLALRYQRLTRGGASGWWTAAFEWRWHWGARD